MRLFRKKDDYPAGFTVTRVELGTHRVAFLKPSDEQLKQLQDSTVLSGEPHGDIPKKPNKLIQILDRLGCCYLDRP